jgi:hypothetical protein
LNWGHEDVMLLMVTLLVPVFRTLMLLDVEFRPM